MCCVKEQLTRGLCAGGKTVLTSVACSGKIDMLHFLLERSEREWVDVSDHVCLLVHMSSVGCRSTLKVAGWEDSAASDNR